MLFFLKRIFNFDCLRFLIVFLNTKIAAFFMALFRPVVGIDTSFPAKLGYATTAMAIDGAWHVIVAWLFSNPRWFHHLRRTRRGSIGCLG